MDSDTTGFGLAWVCVEVLGDACRTSGSNDLGSVVSGGGAGGASAGDGGAGAVVGLGLEVPPDGFDERIRTSRDGDEEI